MATKKEPKAKTKKAATAVPQEFKKTVAGEPRRFTPASFRKRRLRRKAERSIARTPVPNAFIIFGRAIAVLRDNWEIFGGLLLIYTLINLLLIGGLSGAQELNDVKDSLGDLFSGNLNKVTSGLGIFTFLIYNGTGVASGASQTFQTMLLTIFSLAFIWALRQAYANNQIRVRDALYNSSYPLVPLFLVILMICVHLIPAVVGSFLFSTLVIDQILTVGWQQALVCFISFMMVVWSFYLLSHSIIAAYIATLPQMTPLNALRSAKEIVRYRRGMVLRKILFLPVLLLIMAAIVMVPLAAFFTAGATAVYFLLTMLAIPIVHAYMFTLYRELIK